jgi:hypothetical protein
MEAIAVEGSPQPLKSLLGTFMAGLMSITEQLWPQAGALWNEDTAVVEQQAVDRLPTVWRRACSKLLAKVLGCCIVLQLSMQGVIVGEEGPGQSQDRRRLITAGQCVGDGVELPGAVLNREVVPEQLGHPRVLRDSCQALVEKELETPVVGSDGERPTPEIRPPMTNSLDQPNELALISWQLGVVRSDRPAEECYGTVSLVQHSAKPSAGRIAVHHEPFAEVRKLKERCGDQRRLEGDESLLGVCCPGEGLPLEKSSQRRCYTAVPSDELPIISGEAEEPAQRSD